jgi:hypothetical protein
MSGKLVMVLRMIVVVVDVGVQQDTAPDHNQRRDERNASKRSRR